MELWSNVIALIVCSCFSCDGKMMKVIYCLIRYEPTGFFLKLYMSTNTAWSLFTLSQARAACGTQSFIRWLQLSLWGFTDWALRVEIGNEPLAGCKKPSPFRWKQKLRASVVIYTAMRWMYYSTDSAFKHEALPISFFLYFQQSHFMLFISKELPLK